MKIVVRRGLSVPLKGAPVQEIDAAAGSARVGFLGGDQPNIRTELLVSEGESVAAGTPLFRDRNRPEVLFVAPLAGRIEAIEIGARRRLASLVLAPEGDEALNFDTGKASAGDGLTTLLLQSGHWPFFRSRPFDRIADPHVRPEAILVTAIDTAPHAPDPKVVLDGRYEDLSRGAEALLQLTEGPVYVCQPDGDLLIKPESRLLAARFAGNHPAGLAGTHIARLSPLKPGRSVWHINYQDVLAIGHLLRTGRVDSHRIISLSGPGVRAPRLIRVPLGTDIHMLVRPELTAGSKIVLSGSVLSGKEVPFLSRYHSQITVLDREQGGKRHWLLAALQRHAAPPAFIPTQALEESFGIDLPLVPLLRALSIGDAETAERLGCLQLAEDDLALVSYAAGGAMDFGARLRDILNQLEEGA